MALLPCGIHSTTYQQDHAYIKTKPQWLFFGALLIVLLFLPQLISLRFIGIINVIGITAIAVIGLQIVTGYAGQVNIGQSAFMGMGAFIAAALARNWSVPFWFSIPLGAIGAAFVGALFGVPALRIKGFYLALTTIAAQIIFPVLILRLPASWFGGGNGLRIEPANFFGLPLDHEGKLYYLIIAWLGVMLFFAFNLVRSRVGRAFIAIRDNDIAADIMGVNIFYYKTLAFFIGALYAGVAGGLWAYYVRYIAVDQFTLWFSVWYIGMLIVGGLGNILGAILGTVFIRSMQELITYLGPQLNALFPQMGGAIWFAGMNVLLGAMIVIFLIFEPRGLAHRWNILKTTYRIWPFPYF